MVAVLAGVAHPGSRSQLADGQNGRLAFPGRIRSAAVADSFLHLLGAKHICVRAG